MGYLCTCARAHPASIGCPRLSEHVFFHNYRYCAETAEDVDTKILWYTHQKAKRNATQFRSPLITPFSRYFRFALRNCFSLFVQVPNRQLLTRGATPDSTTERLALNLLESLQIECETSWISVAPKYTSSTLRKDEKWPHRQARMESKITPVPGRHEGASDSG